MDIYIDGDIYHSTNGQCHTIIVKQPDGNFRCAIYIDTNHITIVHMDGSTVRISDPQADNGKAAYQGDSCAHDCDCNYGIDDNHPVSYDGSLTDADAYARR